MRQGIRSPRSMGGLFDGWSMDSFLFNVNPLNSPVTQSVVQGAAQAVVGTVQVVTAPLVAGANALGIDLNPTHSPVFQQAIKPAADLIGTALVGVPLGTAAAGVGNLVGTLQDKSTGAGPFAPRTYTVQQQAQLPAPLPPTASPTAWQQAEAQARSTGMLPPGVPLKAVQNGYRAGTFPRYYRTR